MPISFNFSKIQFILALILLVLFFIIKSWWWTKISLAIYLILMIYEIIKKEIFIFDFSFFLAIFIFNIFYVFLKDDALPYLGTIIYFSLFITSILQIFILEFRTKGSESKKDLQWIWVVSFFISFLLSFLLMPKVGFIFAPIIITFITLLLKLTVKKKTALFFFVFIFLFLPLNVDAQNIFIKEIKIITKNKTDAKVILNYLTLQEKQKIDSTKLNQEINKSRRRLLELGYIYAVKIYKVEGKENKNEIKLVIEVEDVENTWLFGVGYLYFTFGKINLSGKGNFWLANIGHSLNSLTYFDPLFSAKNKLYLTASAYNYWSSLWERQISAYIFDLRKKINPYFYMGNKLSYENSTANDQLWGLSLYSFGNDFDSFYRTKEGSFLRGDLEVFRDFTARRNFFRISVGGQKYIPLRSDLVFNFKNYLGTSSGWLPNLKLYNLAHIDGLRGGELENWIGNSYLLLSSELIFFRNEKNIFEGILFSDFGRTWSENEPIKIEKMNFTYGAGIRGYVLPPINFNFRVEYGISQKGMGTLFIKVWQNL